MKIINLLASLALSVNAFTQVPTYLPTNGLVGYWPFNGDANDVSGNGHNGTIDGGITSTSDRFGNTNSAYKFYGSTTGFIDIPDHNDLSFTNNQFTFAFWMFPDLDASANFRTILSKYSASNGREYKFSIPKDETSIIVEFSNFVNGNDCPVYSENTASTIHYIYDWSQYIITGDGNVLNTYINGILVSTINRNYSCNLENTSNSLWIGRSYDNRRMKGSLDDIGIWSRALTSQEITNLYSRSTLTTGVHEKTIKNSVQIYPNPSKNMITISNANMIDAVIIIDVLGNEISTTTNNRKVDIEINLSNLLPGIYFAKLINNKENTIDIRRVALQ